MWWIRNMSRILKTSSCLMQPLPQPILDDIVNRVGDAKDIAVIETASKELLVAGRNVTSLRLVCLKEYHDIARAEGERSAKELSAQIERERSAKELSAQTERERSAKELSAQTERERSAKELSAQTERERSAKELSAQTEGERGAKELSAQTEGERSAKELSAQTEGRIGQTRGTGEASTSGSSQVSEKEKEKYKFPLFRDLVVQILKQKPNLIQLRIEIESKLQSKTVPEGERRRTDHWLTDPYHLKKWIPYVSRTLEHLCIVDYGQQAIMRRTDILKTLSNTCSLLKTLDLRNMFIDTEGFGDMPSMTSFTMRCVKVCGSALQDINNHMPNLQTLALLGVFGVTQGDLTFPDMKVLCLGLSTMAKDVIINLPNLVKLQLKMLCPEKLSINCPNLKFFAFNLEVQDQSKLELKNLNGLQELLYGASGFNTLRRLATTNPRLDKLFLDIPCMALGEDGKWLGVLSNVELTLPDFNHLQDCERLSILNIGPGLWYSMEINVEMLSIGQRWPPLRNLILHMIPHKLETCLKILQILLKPTVTSLEIFVHSNSPVEYDELIPQVEAMIIGIRVSGQDIVFKHRLWTKSLDFSCFSF